MGACTNVRQAAWRVHDADAGVSVAFARTEGAPMSPGFDSPGEGKSRKERSPGPKYERAIETIFGWSQHARNPEKDDPRSPEKELPRSPEVRETDEARTVREAREALVNLEVGQIEERIRDIEQ